MEYALLGKTGLLVSRLAFGAMTFTEGNRDLPTIYNVAAGEADRLVGQAVDAGVNFFDTADVYARGQSEEILGRALKSRRDSVIIATKVGGRFSKDPLDAGLSRRHIMRSVDASLKRLGTDWIDCYIVHRDCPYTPLEETLRALDAIVRAGKVRYLGFSNWAAWRVAAAMEIMKANNLAPFTHGQMFYSLAARDLESEFVPMIAQYGLGMTVWSPLAGGFLTGKYPRNAQPQQGTRHAGFDMMPIDVERGHGVIDAIGSVARRLGVSNAQIAITWLLERRAVTSVLLGATKSEQLADTLKSAALRLGEDDMAVLDAASAMAPSYPRWFLERFGDRRMDALLSSARPLRD